MKEQNSQRQAFIQMHSAQTYSVEYTVIYDMSMKEVCNTFIKDLYHLALTFGHIQLSSVYIRTTATTKLY